MEVIYLYSTKYMWVIVYVSFLSFAGGITSYMRQRKDGVITSFRLGGFLIHMTIAGFVGVITYLVCKGVGLNELLTAAAIGISSHMGTPAIVFIEELIQKIVCKYFKVDCKE